LLSQDLNGQSQWTAGGEAFFVHEKDEFWQRVLGKYFSKCKYSSFVRQLNLYGFTRVTTRDCKGAFMHPCFKRDHPELLDLIVRGRGMKTFSPPQRTMLQTQKKSTSLPSEMDNGSYKLGGSEERKNAFPTSPIMTIKNQQLEEFKPPAVAVVNNMQLLTNQAPVTSRCTLKKMNNDKLKPFTFESTPQQRDLFDHQATKLPAFVAPQQQHEELSAMMSDQMHDVKEQQHNDGSRFGYIFGDKELKEPFFTPVGKQHSSAAQLYDEGNNELNSSYILELMRMPVIEMQQHHQDHNNDIL